MHAVRCLVALLLAVYVSWAVALPSTAGSLGRLIHGGLFGAFGHALYLVPVLLLYGLVWYFRTEDLKGFLTVLAGSTLTLAGGSLFLSGVGKSFSRPEWGGRLGEVIGGFGNAALGAPGTLLLSVAAVLLGLQILFGVSWWAVLARAVKIAVEDYRAWKRDRAGLRALLTDAALKRKEQGEEKAGMAPIPAEAKREDSPAIQEPVLIMTASEPSKPERSPKSAKAGRNGKGEQAQERAEPVFPPPGDTPYTLPPTSLLTGREAGARTGRPTETETQEAIATLDRTLSSFEIGAKVTGISPGPVITRYEVSPQPGVSVNSIVARANDIALALKARGIRMIAPIPGKAAIGIELPNREGATVRLREVMESDAFAKGGPLSFALGLSAEGKPLTADLQSMPHLLVAGATNSGKSVMVHSLISSILMRQRPDQVKFLLIDPKRIEMTFYEGIPHLYDPKTPPEEVKVITNAKAAAASLKALVKVMERRYEMFQEYKARDIDSFNREAARRGKPGEFFIVVVIDELADLMVVARDVVEDSIQRLAQMARAVGIHLVIATQRPSVDVLTGVIKANLPTRIAMRVASKVDSKVILDGNGAEALLGKGDALYMTPGIDAMRIQGCFVTPSEITALVEHLQKQGHPSYPLLDVMTSAVAEADLSQFGVEVLEFTQALVLVLERRRVSQDLLKSQFGSSARATNILSLLEIKGFINKPEGSNRWNIHFDKIEDYLRKHCPQALPEQRGKG